MLPLRFVVVLLLLLCWRCNAAAAPQASAPPEVVERPIDMALLPPLPRDLVENDYGGSVYSALGGKFRFFWRLLCLSNSSATTWSLNVTSSPAELERCLRDTTSVLVAEMALRCEVSGWCGIGFGRKMTGADGVIGYGLADGSVFVGDYAMISKDLCNRDHTNGVCADTDVGGSDDILAYNGSDVNGVLILKFYHALDTRDTDGLDRILLPNSSIDALFALYNGPKRLEAHRNRDSGNFRFSLTGILPPTTTTNRVFQETLISVHGWFMWFAYGVVFPLGSLYARYMKASGRRVWYYVHIVIQMFGILSAIIAFVLIIVEMDDAQHDHFSSSHMQLGIVVIIFALGQPVFGLVARLVSRPGDWLRYIPAGIHGIVGWITLVLGFAALWTGVVDEQELGPKYIALLAFWTVLLFALFVFLLTVQSMLDRSLIARPQWWWQKRDHEKKLFWRCRGGGDKEEQSEKKAPTDASSTGVQIEPVPESNGAV